MRGELFARFMELRGRRIIEGAGSLWYSVPTKPRIFMNSPLQDALDIEPELVQDMLRRHGGLGARFPSSHLPGLESGLYVCRLKQYDITTVHRKSRSCIRRGLEQLVVRRVDESELLIQGLGLNHDTMARQGRFEAEFGDTRKWKRLVEAVRRCPGVEAWGSFLNGALAAYAITLREDRWLHILHQMSSTEALHAYPNDTLTFELTRLGAADPQLDAICYGIAGLVAGGGLHEYKLRHGYQAEPMNSAFVFHPVAAPVLGTAAAAWTLGRLRKWFPADQRLERISAVIEAGRRTRAGAGVNLAVHGNLGA
jgi:hypothetical protein